MPTLSFVMSYFERPEQLKSTLKVLRRFFQKDDQLVIVDDASCPEKSARAVLKSLELPCELVEIAPERKNWINPGIPYNIGFQLANRDAVVIMNSECIPVNGAIDRLRTQVNDHNYVVMPCYSTTQKEFVQISDARDRFDDPSLTFQRILSPLKKAQWFHHPTHAPTWYHFTSCIALQNLRSLGGFNEEFAQGFCFEDNELLWRIRKRLTVEGWDENLGYVIHQWHSKSARFYGGCAEWERNRKLWDSIREGKA